MDPRMKRTGVEYNFGERDGSARPNEAGVYYHPQADKFVETAHVKTPDGDPSYFHGTGKIQADAFVQLGYRKATPEELEAYRASVKDKEKANRIKASRSTTIL